jgi:hypothetical protein
LELILAVLLYPGLALALALALLFRSILEARVPRIAVRMPLRSADSVVGLASIGLAALALALLPWPLHPLGSSAIVGSPLALWATLEGAFLAPLLPGLLAPSPFAMRAAVREAQIGAAGRFVIWMAIGIALWSASGWGLAALPGRALAGVAGLLALPAGAGVGPFAAERSLSAAGVEEGLDETTADLLRFARSLRAAVLLAALLVASLPSAASGAAVQDPIVLLVVVALFVAIVLLLRRFSRILPRLTLPGALRWCWWRALPLAVAGVVYLIVV